MYEFFAGRGNLSRCMKASGRKTASFDILYNAGKPDRKKPYGSNSMDFNSPSGFASIVMARVNRLFFLQGGKSKTPIGIMCEEKWYQFKL